jgi:hypothetical protein
VHERTTFVQLQAGDFEAAARDAQSQRSAGGRTARRQAWAANDVFSDSEGEGAPSVSTAPADSLTHALRTCGSGYADDASQLLHDAHLVAER